MIQILTHFFSNFNLDKLETIERNPTIDIVVRTDCGYTCTLQFWTVRYGGNVIVVRHVCGFHTVGWNRGRFTYCIVFV